MKSAIRLALYKVKAKQQGKNWRQVVPSAKKKKTWYQHTDGNIHTDALDSFGGYLGDVYDVMKSNPYVYRNDYPAGYYTDQWCDNTLIGFVSVLKTRKYNLYIPGIRHSEYDCITLYLNDAEKVEKCADTDANDRAKYKAARTADGIAETQAEKEREYNEAYENGRMFAEKGAEIKDIKKDFLAIRREYKKARHLGEFPSLCSALREKLLSMLRDIRKLKKEREELGGQWYSGTCHDAFMAGKADFS